MKTLIRKSDKVYLKYMDGDFYESNIPTILSENAKLENLIDYAENFDNIIIDEEMLDNIELINIVVISQSEGMVVIPAQEYEYLLKSKEKLQALESAGVDNWSGYSYAMENIEK